MWLTLQTSMFVTPVVVVVVVVSAEMLLKDIYIYILPKCSNYKTVCCCKTFSFVSLSS